MASNNFINECKNRSNGNRLGKLIIDGVDNPITNADKLQSFSIDSGCYVDGDIIGSVYAKCLKANFITNMDDLIEKSVQAQIGVKYADLNTEYINMGKYKAERPNNEITANMSRITTYSDLYTNLDDKYVCGIDYSSENKTLKDLYVDVCGQLGLIPKTTNILNGNIPISNNPFTNGEKNRTVLQTIAKISCSFVDIDNDTNEIDSCWLSQNEEPDYIFYKNDYVSVEGGQIVCGPINCLIIKNSQIDDENVTIKDDESITINGEHSIIINEDYILHDAELRQQAITSIWNRVKGMKYVDCKLITYYGKPFLKLGDKIRVYTSETKYFDTYVLKHQFTYDGSFASIIESPALTEQEIKTKQDIGLKEALKNTQIDVNKQKQEIKATVEQVSQQNEKLSQMTMDVNSINSKVQEVSSEMDVTKTETANLQLKVNEISSAVQIGGGSNMLQNSVGLYGMDGITVENNRFYFKPVTNLVVGDTYTLTFKYSNETNNSIKVLLDNVNEEEILVTNQGVELDEVVYTFIAKDTNVQLIIEMVGVFDTLSGKITNLIGRTISEAGFILTGKELNRSFLITDTIFRKSLTRNDWEPASGEILGTTLSVYYNGIEVSSINADIKTKINNMGFVVTNNYDQIVLSVTKDFVLLTNTQIDGDLYIKTTYFKEIPINGDRHLVVGGDIR